MSIATTTIGPKDNGRRMNLDDFDRAEGHEGFQYELSRGVVTVTEIARPDHGKLGARLMNRGNFSGSRYRSMKFLPDPTSRGAKPWPEKTYSINPFRPVAPRP